MSERVDRTLLFILMDVKCPFFYLHSSLIYQTRLTFPSFSSKSKDRKKIDGILSFES